MTLSITPGRSVDVDEVIDGLAPRDPAVEAEFLAAFYRFHREKTGEREATTRESLNKILSRSGKDFDVYGLYRGCCQRGGFHSREHAKRHMSFAEVYREMNNYDVVNTYTDIGKRLLDAYEKYLLAYEGEHPDDINADKCDVCEREDGAMIQCDHCETWTHEQCHRPRALQRQPIQYPEANAENTAGAGNTNTAGGADDRADSDSDQMNDLAAIAKAKKRVKFRLVFICDSCASMHVDDPDDPDASYLSASLLPIPPAQLAHLSLAPEFAKLPKDKMMSADTYCQLLIARRRFVPLKSGRRCREDPTVPVHNKALENGAANARANNANNVGTVAQRSGPRTMKPPVKKKSNTVPGGADEDYVPDGDELAIAFVDAADWPSEDEDGPNRDLARTIKFNEDEITRLADRMGRLPNVFQEKAISIIIRENPSMDQHEIDLVRLNQETLFELDDFLRVTFEIDSRAAELKENAVKKREEAERMDLEEPTQPGVTTTARKSAPAQPEIVPEEFGELEEEEETLAQISEEIEEGKTLAQISVEIEEEESESDDEDGEETLAHISEGSRVKKRESGKKNPFLFFNKETRPILRRENPTLTFAEAGKKVGEMWRALDADEKALWGVRAAQAAERVESLEGGADELSRKRRLESNGLASNSPSSKKPAIAADSPIVITDDVDADATASESHDDTVSEDDDRPLAEIVGDVTAAREAQRKARVPEGWVPPVNSTEVTLGANGRRGAVMIQPPAIDPENESKAETWRRLRGLPPKATFEAEPATTPKGVGATGERPFKIPKRSPAGGEGVDSRLTVMTDLDRYTRGDPQRMNDAVNAYRRSEDPLGSSYDWEKLRVKQKRAEEAKRAQERAAKRGLDEAEFAEAGDESGPIDLTSEGDRFDFTGDRFDSPPSSPLHRARDDRPGNPSPGKGIRASAAPLDPRMRRKLGDDAQEDATRDPHGTGRMSRFDQTPADREVASTAPGASLVAATASLESPRRSERKTGKDKDDYYLRRSAPTNAPGKCGRARKGHCAICDYTNHKTADCKRQCKNCGAHNHTTAKCMRPIACPICIAPGHTADLCAAVRDPGGKGKETSGKGNKWCECCRSTSHNLDSCRSKFVPCRHCGKKGHLRRYCPQLETPRGFEPGQPEPARNHNAGLTAHTSDRARNPFPPPGFNSDDLRRLSDDYHSGLRSPDRKDFRNSYPDGPNSRAQGSHFTEPRNHNASHIAHTNPTPGRFFEYDAAQPGCKLCRVNFDGAKCVRERHNKGSGHQSALKRLADQCKEGGGGVGGSRGAVESFPGTRREPVADRDDRVNSLPSLRVRTGVESPSTSPDPVQVFSPKEPGEVGNIDRDRTVSPSPGKVVQVRSFEGEKVRVTSPPKVRSPGPSPEKVRHASPPNVRSPMDAPNSPTAMRVRGSLPTCPHCGSVHPDWVNCRIKRREERYAIEELHGRRGGPPCPHCGKVHSLDWGICKQRLANNGGKDKPEPAVLQRLKWSAGGSPRTNGSPRAHTPASPAETRQRCDKCNCNVSNGAHGMKLHQEGKRHKGMVQLMRL